MVIKFGEELWECSLVERRFSNVRSGDFLLDFATDSESLVRVETVQPDSYDFFLHKFIALISRTATGEIVMGRKGLSEKTMVYRPKKCVFRLEQAS